MKVFWAWQSDTPGKTGRHFVREALEQAIVHLKQPKDIEEPPEVSRRNDLHLDHDTKGLKGSPEVAHEIFKKIAASSVVVADVTPVGAAPAKDATAAKPLMNPNVALELGFAFGKLGPDCFLPVLNLAYGDQKSLPFDIAHRRFPIVFTLPEGAAKEQIESEKKQLVSQFVTALEPYIAAQPSPPEQEDFPAATAKMPPAFYFDNAEVLFRVERVNSDFVMPFRSVLYMRIYPRKRIDGHLDLNMLRDNVGRYGVFGLPNGSYIMPNKYGVMVGCPAGNTANLDAVLQYFRTGEIWGINADILRQGESGRHRFLFTQPFENLFVGSLSFALQFHREVTRIGPPFYVEVGAVGVANRSIAHMGYALSSSAPVIASDVITHSGVLNNTDEPSQRELLLRFFEKVNKDSGIPRPDKLYGR